MGHEAEKGLDSSGNQERDQPENIEPVKSARVVVSVAFQKNDFARVAASARRHGKKTSEFIRDAALEQAGGQSPRNQIYAFGNSGSLWLGNTLPSVTQVRSAEIKQILNDTALTSS
jgi:hypothetical protein